LGRHPTLSRKPQPVAAARIKGFTPENVAAFFDIFEKEMEKISFSPNRLFSVDETGITVVQHKTSTVIALKGKKAVDTLSSSERGALVTVVTCMSASGIFVPPLLVFPRKNTKLELLDGTPPGTIGVCHPSGWIQSEIFTKWFQHFIVNVKPSPDDLVLLVLDGHYSHTKNVEIIEMARANGVAIVWLPPHSTHEMQPLDVSIMSPFKIYHIMARKLRGG
jgi:hypothetical protein